MKSTEYDLPGGSLQFVRRFRIPALFCALAVMVCELISSPYTTMGICDDGPYILMTQKLATTGHVVYNGWAAPMLTWQLYLGAALVKLFGFSFTTVRISTLLVAVALAFLFQRTMVRANISERNATIGTLAVVLSPLYLMLSVTFMTDLHGLLAIVLCLYGCLRALQSCTSRATIGWICFAIATNALCGTSRQIAWLGILVMVPSTLWLLRSRRRVFLAGAAATLTGVLFIYACMQWLKLQPYSIPEHLVPNKFSVAHIFAEFIHAILDVPFLLLPIVVLFLPKIRNSGRRATVIISIISLGYVILALHWRSPPAAFLLEPTLNDQWVNVHGIFEGTGLQGRSPILFGKGIQVILTLASMGGVFGLISFLLRPRSTSPLRHTKEVTWNQLVFVLAPFTLIYILFLLPRAASAHLADRYLLGFLVAPTICLVRYYQEQVQRKLPLACAFMVGIMAICGVAMTHNMFALYRARVAMAAQIRDRGILQTSVDNGWEYNLVVELEYADSLNLSTIVIPTHTYVPTHPPSANSCQMLLYDVTPHIHPLYGVSFDPNACYGPAPFAPVTYSRWLASKPGTLYIVRYTAPSKP